METKMLSVKGLKDLKRFLESREGFTLVEIIMVVAVMGILVSVAAPNFSKWVEKHQINGEAQKVYFDLMLARTSAVKNNSLVRVAFDTTAHTYTIHGDLNNDGIQDAGEAVKTGTLENNVQFAKTPATPNPDGNAVALPVSFGAGGAQTVIFDSRGQADNSGSVFLLHTSDIAAVSSDRARCVTVLAATGGVDYWTYDGGSTPPWK